MRYPKSLSHFFPECNETVFPIRWEKSYVTGLEAANLVIDYLEDDSFAKIIPAEADEPHIEALRTLNRNLNGIREQLPWSGYFLH
ncbi:hypothetical protein AKJ16_DCAP14575 [Drosera capensis]